MSNPTIFKGNVEIQAGTDPTLYGLGHLDIEYDMTVGGVVSELNSDNVVIKDNLPIVNYNVTTDAGYDFGRDMGLMGARTLNDVITDTPYETDFVVSATINTLTLDPSTSNIDNFYNGFVVLISSGIGVGQINTIINYVGATHEATMRINWIVIPDVTSTYELFNGRNTTVFWQESGKQWIIGTTPNSNGSSTLEATPGTLHVGNLIVDGTITGIEEIVALPDNSSVRVDITKTGLTGSYLIIVNPLLPNGANATFSASKAYQIGPDSTIRITSADGFNGEQLDIEWNNDQKVQLFHSITSGVGTLIYYKVQIVSSDILGGENNTGANVGNAGVGVYDGKTGVTLDFRNLAPGSNKITTTLDVPNKNILIDAVESNFTLDNIGGVLSVAKGGTSLTSLTSNRFLVGNGIGPIDLTKVVPTGDVVGTSDAQTLTNKTLTDPTNNVLARGLWYGSGAASVSTYASGAPVAGYQLVATSATTAVWQAPVAGSNEFEYIESPNAITTTYLLTMVGSTLTGGYTKISWTTATKPIGTYRIGYQYDWTTNTTTRDFIAVVMVDGTDAVNIGAQFRTGIVSNAGGSDTDSFAIRGSGNNQRESNTGFFYRTFGSSSTHQIDLIFGRSSGDGTQSVSMSDARIEIWRVL